MNATTKTTILLGFLLLWGFCYLISSFVAGHQCYYLEKKDDGVWNGGGRCYKGDGWATIMTVDTAKTFVSVTTGLFVFGHGCYTLFVLRKGVPNSRKLNVLFGLSLAACLTLLQMAVFWGTQELLQQEFGTHGASEEGTGGSTRERVFEPNTGLVGVFAGLCAFSTLTLLCEMALSYVLYAWADDLIAESGEGGAGFNYGQFGGDAGSSGSGGSYHQPAAAAEPPMYNDL